MGERFSLLYRGSLYNSPYGDDGQCASILRDDPTRTELTLVGRSDGEVGTTPQAVYERAENDGTCFGRGRSAPAPARVLFVEFVV